MKKEQPKLLLATVWLLILFGGLMRLFKLDWGEGYFFHPDERIIAGSVAQLKFPEQMNPNSFIYGSFPIYLNFLMQNSAADFLPENGRGSFEAAMMRGRLISALASIVTIGLTYWIGKNLFSRKAGVLASLFVAVSPGLIQYAHFLTFESLLSLEILLVVFFAYRLLVKNRGSDWVGLGLCCGIAIGTKVTSLLFLAVYPIIVFKQLKRRRSKWRRLIIYSLLSLITAAAMFLLTDPFTVWDYHSFSNTIKWEGGIANGAIPVFYTRQFFSTVPFIFQLRQIFPWILGTPLTLLLIPALIFSIDRIRKSDSQEHLALLGVTVPYLLFNSCLFVKWTRYMVPLIPLFGLLAAEFLIWLAGKQFAKRFCRILITCTVILSVLSGISFSFMYKATDTRITAAHWFETNTVEKTKILTEAFDLGILPLYELKQANLSVFNFYELDSSQRDSVLETLAQRLTENGYFVVLSPRVWKNALNHPERFETTANFYTNLFAGKLGFEKTAEFSSEQPWWSFVPKEAGAEETFTVFDRPELMIFRKIQVMTKQEYLAVLKV